KKGILEIPEEGETQEGFELYRTITLRALDYVFENRLPLGRVLRTNKNSLAYFMIFNMIKETVTELLLRTGEKSRSDLPLEIDSQFMTSGLSGVVFYWLEGDGPVSEEELTGSLLRIISRNV
ncbi:MAG: TetR-like C-terminal domain-containing protein, partial [Spirochaetales bacterium]|nr:TetR-like C-terminal domain-containing protein [Spirochaetales bacterium]